MASMASLNWLSESKGKYTPETEASLEFSFNKKQITLSKNSMNRQESFHKSRRQLKRMANKRFNKQNTDFARGFYI